MFHPVFFFTLCCEGPHSCPHPCPCPCTMVASVIRKAPSSTFWKSSSLSRQQHPLPKCLKMLQRRAMSIQHRPGLQGAANTHPCPGIAGAVSPLPRLVTWHRAKTRPLRPSSIQQNHVGRWFIILTAQVGGRNLTSARRIYQHDTFNLYFPLVFSMLCVSLQPLQTSTSFFFPSGLQHI